MARGTLPWLKGSSTQTTPNAKPTRARREDAVSGTPARASAKRRRLSPPKAQHSDSDSDLNATGLSTPQRKARHEPTNRNPSSSPPPPIPTEAEPMRAGLRADDQWIMVEDELLATAKLFTRQLHHEEYQRLKRLVKDQETAEPFLGGAISATSLERSQPKRKRTGVSKAVDDFADDADAADPWQADSQLASLMDSPRKNAKLLKSSTFAVRAQKSKPAPSARTSLSPSPVTGHARRNVTVKEEVHPRSSKKAPDRASRSSNHVMPSDDEDGDDEDLDRETALPPRSLSAKTNIIRESSAHTAGSTGSSDIFKRFAREPPSHPARSRSPIRHAAIDKPKDTSPQKSTQRGPNFTKETADMDRFDDSPFKSSAEAEAIIARRSARTAKRLQAEQKQQRADASILNEKNGPSPRKRRPSTPSEIPTFLF